MKKSLIKERERLSIRKDVLSQIERNDKSIEENK